MIFSNSGAFCAGVCCLYRLITLKLQLKKEESINL